MAFTKLEISQSMESGFGNKASGRSKRLIWIDIAKGLAIILVVFGHAQISPTVAKMIYAFLFYTVRYGI